VQIQFPTILDSSMLGTYKSCARKFYLTYLEHLKAKEPNVHLHAGKSFASGIEAARRAYYEGLYSRPFLITEDDGKGGNVKGKMHEHWEQGPLADSETAVGEGLGVLLREYGNFSCPPESAKSLERMAGALEFYYTSYPLEHDSAIPIQMPGGKRGIEFSFSLPLPIRHPDSGDPLLYCGRMDAITSFASGVFVTDEKTATSLGPSWARQWDLRSQFTGYCWALREHGVKCDGVLVRGVSILKTKYDTQQAISYRPDWQIDRWYANMLTVVQRLVDEYLVLKSAGVLSENLFEHNLDDACTSYGNCGFYDACRSEDPTTWLVTNFARKLWNPLLRTETLLEG
jgi:PD-(D/E)XK nuclease superfamily